MTRKAINIKIVLAILLHPLWIYGNDSLAILDQAYVETALVLEENKSLSSPQSRYSPSWYFDGIAFVGPIESSKRAFTHIWYAPLSESEIVAPFHLKIQRDSAMHDGPLAWDAENERVFFTRSQRDSSGAVTDEEGRVRLQIYQAKTKNSENWEDIQMLGFSKQGFSSCHPTYNHFESVLIFASDRPGGYGGMDLYFVKENNGKWSEPVNLGSDINTKHNEVFPFITESGYLLFSSDRKGIGGLDIYLGEEENGNWRYLDILPGPFNSSSDDFGLILDGSSRQGYLSSNRESKKKTDRLYQFNSSTPLLPVREIPDIVSTLVLVDGTTGKLIKGAEVGLFPYSTDLFSGENPLFRTSIEVGRAKGEEMVLSYQLDKEVAGETLKSSDNLGQANFSVDPRAPYLAFVSHPKFQLFQGVIDPSQFRSGDPISITLTPDQKKNIHFTFTSNQGEILSDLEVFVTLLPEGTGNYYKIESDGGLRTGIYQSRDYKMVVLKDGYRSKNFVFNLEKEGITDALIVYLDKETPEIVYADRLSPEQEENSSAEIEKIVNEAEEEEAPILVLEQIFYDFNDTRIKQNYAFELDILADIMGRMQDVTVELAAHTDSRGEPEYNIELSLKRAEAAKIYLVERGIDANRILTKGFGESKLRNHCKDGVECSEEEHQYNRRTEVRIIKD